MVYLSMVARVQGSMVKTDACRGLSLRRAISPKTSPGYNVISLNSDFLSKLLKQVWYNKKV